MKRTIAAVVAVPALFAGGWMSSELSGQPDGMEPMSEEALFEHFQASGRPTMEHGALLALVGEWDYTFTFTAPGTPVSEHKGRGVFEPVLDGRGVLFRSDMDMAMLGRTVPVQGIGVLGYNRHTGEYQNAWLDTLDPYMIFSTGKREGDHLVLEGPTYHEGQMAPMRTVWTLPDGDSMRVEFLMQFDPDRGWEQTGVIDYRK